MFLRPLNNQQKELVLGLAYLAAKANHVIEAKEEECLRLYADEMGIELKNASTLSLYEICLGLKEISNQKEINQIVFEIVGLMMSDFEYDTIEQDFMDQLIGYLGVSHKKLEIMVAYVNEYFALTKKINALMFD